MGDYLGNIYLPPFAIFLLEVLLLYNILVTFVQS